MGIGIPGSGKTTTLKPFAAKNSYVYISPDDIRVELAGDAADQSNNKEVWQVAYRRVAESLGRGETVVFDATFAKDVERKSFIHFAREHGAEKIQGVFAAVPFEIANERNMERDRVVPEYAVDRMYTMLKENPPIIEDGFDSVFDTNELQELERVEMKIGDNTVTREFKQKLR